MPVVDVTRRASARGRPTWLLVLAGLLLVGRVAAGVHEWRSPPRPPDLVRWSRPAAVQTAPGKAVLYDFTADWCEPCQDMKREVFGERQAAAFINRHFVPVRVDAADESTAASALRDRYGVTSFPTLIVERQGRGPVRMSAYRGRAATLALLRKALL